VLLYRRIHEHRSTVVFIVIVLLCLASLASGTQANRITRGIRTAASVAATPFWLAFSYSADAASYVVSFFTSYNAAFEEAETLRAELTSKLPRLVALHELEAENARLREMLEFREREPRLDLQVATVQVKVIGRFEGALMINQGSMHGVREAMCVMTADGIVGVVAEVQPFQSFVYTLHHADCRIGAMVERTRAFGLVRGSGSDVSHICRMEYIDIKDEIRPGDLVVTSGGAVFPKGYPIGVISAIPESGGATLRTAYVRPLADPYRLDEVFLVRRAQPSPEELSGWTPPEPVDPDDDAAMPDSRTLQERYAP